MRFTAGRGFDHRGHFGEARAGTRQMAEPLGLERLDDKQDSHANRDGLGKNKPKAAHNLVFFRSPALPGTVTGAK